MEKNMFKKGLVVGIIFLFIGVSVQPAFAKNTIKTTISETLEDCECQTVSNHNLDRLDKLSIRTNMLLNRAKIFTNIVGILSKNNPEISKEKFEELSNRITILKEINEKQLWPGHPICTALLFITFSLYIAVGYYYDKAQHWEGLGFDGIADLFYAISDKIFDTCETLAILWDELGCNPDST
jgi:hypothetical protein